MEREEEGEWIVYKGDVSINEFLTTNRPSLIEKSLNPWIAVYYPQRSPRKTLDKDALLGELLTELPGALPSILLDSKWRNTRTSQGMADLLCKVKSTNGGW